MALHRGFVAPCGDGDMKSFLRNFLNPKKSKTLSPLHPPQQWFLPSFFPFPYLSPVTAPSPAPSLPIILKKKPNGIPRPCLMLHPCPSDPAAPRWVKWSVPAPGESRVLSSAQLCWAASVPNLLCDYCQSETPPPRRSALMGTVSPGTASHRGRDEPAKVGGGEGG